MSSLPKSLPPIEGDTEWSLTKTTKPTSNGFPAIILKSGILYKKGEGVMANTYKQRLFEFTVNGELIYYELKSNGEKIKKDEILLTPSIKIEKRSGGRRRDAKFIIHINENKKWYLWCNNRKNNNQIQKSPSSTIYKRDSPISPKSKTNLISSPNYYKPTLFQSPSNPKISTTNINISSSSGYTSLTSISVSLSTSSNCSASLLSPNTKILIPQKVIQSMTSSVQDNVYDDRHKNGKIQAQEWCDILNNFIQNVKSMNSNSMQKHNTYKSRSKSYPLTLKSSSSNHHDYDDEKITVEWTIKECYLMLKCQRAYKRMYFILSINGKLDYYTNDTIKDKKGCIDIINQCIGVEKRRGSPKRDCKFIIHTRKNSYYFWCKDDKKLSLEWYKLIKRITVDKMKNLNHYLEIAHAKSLKSKCDENDNDDTKQKDD